MIRTKELATWLPSPAKLLKQFCLSLLSYATLPLYKEKDNGVQIFFRHNYSVEPDEFIFDGTTNGYFSKVNHFIELMPISEMEIVDLGCGKGSFYEWLCSKKVSIRKYTGIDFSINNTQLDKTSSLVCDDINNIQTYIAGNKTLVTMCNSLCYIDYDEFSNVLGSLHVGNHLIIIEPAPHLFWDAHFSGVKPYYRNHEAVCEILSAHGYVVQNLVTDYLFKLGKRFYSEMSYGIYAYKVYDICA